MSSTLDRLYGLLPAIYRIRDAERGEPLKALLSVVAKQVGVLEEDLRQLYDDQFIETCRRWAIPYVGDAIGYRPLHGEIPSVRHPRGEVADTIALRRHKGTVAMLEVLAREVTGWDARVVEFFELLGWTQSMSHLRPQATLADLRRNEPLERLGGAFESIQHTVDVRRIAVNRGRFNIPNVGVFLWRLGAKPLTRASAFRLPDRTRFLFSPLGNSAPLFTRPRALGAIDEFDRRVGRLEVPDPLGRRVTRRYHNYGTPSASDYYGDGKSFYLWDVGLAAMIPSSQVRICDLSNVRNASGQPTSAWGHSPAPANQIAVDPVLGRIVFDAPRDGAVEVMFHSGFSDDLGGGEYDRQESVDRWHDPSKSPVKFQAGVTRGGGAGAGIHGTITAALSAWNAWTANNPPGLGVICVMDSRTYRESPLEVKVPAGYALAIVAASWPEVAGQRALGAFSPVGCWPTIARGVRVTGTPHPPENPGTLILDGLRIGGTLSVQQPGALGRLALSHVTVVPWPSLGVDRLPLPTADPRIVCLDPGCRIEADGCVLGGFRGPAEGRVRLSNCILDATRDTNVAYSAVDGSGPGPALTILNSTVVGKLRTSMLELASNSIFMSRLDAVDPDWLSPLRSERRQHGCVRFCRLPEGARVPRRYRCQPDLALEERVKELGLKSVEELLPGEVARQMLRMTPEFHSLAYGDPAYCQLGRRTAREIREGAEDGSEMGAFHDLYQPHREHNLRIRLDEYLRFGLEAGSIFAT